MSEERKLVTVRQVGEVKPIPNADNIEVAIVDGWECVVKKGEFRKGDYGIYCEIDSAIPLSDSRFAFLEKQGKEWNGRRVAVLKTIRLRGQISQGLLLPLTNFPEVQAKALSLWGGQSKRYLQTDYAELLGIEKYEREAQESTLRGGWFHKFLVNHFSRETRTKIYNLINFFIPKKLKKKGRGGDSFPGFIQKTDEYRIQNIFFKLKEAAANGDDPEYEASIKLDGSSSTNYVYKGEFGHCSRNLKLGLNDGSNFSKVVLKYGIERNLPLFCESIGRQLAFQGELMGPGIQGNKDQLEDHDLYLFKIYDIDNQCYVGPAEFKYLVEQYNASVFPTLRLKTAPRLPGTFRISDFATVADILKFAKGPSINNDVREGLVFQRLDGKFSFKAISNEFLLKYKD